MTETPQNKINTFPILIVDDNLLLRTILERNLQEAGYEAVGAENGKQALEIFKSGYYPIVMTDWIMPEMDGLELCRAIRQDDSGRYTYIIMFTSLETKNDIIAGLDAGADEYLTKPVHQPELLTRLKTAHRILNLENSLKKSLEEITSLSRVDPLTGIFNKRYIDERFPQEIRRAYRYERSLSVIFAGINDFKEIVRTHGHYTADLVLKECAESIAEAIRKEIDWVARYDEEKFLIVLPETDAVGSMILAKRLRFRIASLINKGRDKEFKVSASFGVAGFSASKQKEGMTMEIILDKADSCLYQAFEDREDSIKGVHLL